MAKAAVFNFARMCVRMCTSVWVVCVYVFVCIIAQADSKETGCVCVCVFVCVYGCV